MNTIASGSPGHIYEACVRASQLGLMAEARLLAHRARAETDESRLALDIGLRLSWIEFQDGQHAEARRWAAETAAAAAAQGDTAREAVARSHWARLLSEDGQQSEAAVLATTALRLARQSGSAFARSVALVVPAILCSRLGLYEAAVELAAFSLNHAEIAGDAEAVAHSISNFGSLHADYLYRFAPVSDEVRHGYLMTAIAESRRATLYAKACGDAEMQRLSGYNLVEFRLLAADLAGAEAAWAMTEAALGQPSRRSAVQRGHVLAHLLLARGDRATALTALRESVARSLAYPFLELALFASDKLSDLLAEMGDFESAYYAHRGFHDLFIRAANEDASRAMQSSILRDKVEEMRGLIAEVEGRTTRLVADNASLRRDTQRFAQEMIEDPLTGLGNRRRLQIAFEALSRERTDYALALIDIDHFKTVNDAHSHAIGDAVLRRIAELTRQGEENGEARLAIRLGGEEFVILLSGQAVRNATAICDTLRLAVETTPWGEIVPGLRVTISIGLALAQEGPDPEAVLALADSRLYEAKNTGRNRLVSAAAIAAAAVAADRAPKIG